MRNYWTCSPFADWIRGTTKLKCGTGKEWAEWEKSAKAQYPIRWWIAEEGLDKINRIGAQQRKTAAGSPKGERSESMSRIIGVG